MNRSSSAADSQAADSQKGSRLQFWDLRFRDQTLERHYRNSYFDNDVKRTRIGLVCAALVLVVFAIAEPLLLDMPPLVNQVRLLLVLPLIFFSLMVSYTATTYVHLLIVGCSMLATLSQILLLPALAAETLTNTTMAYLQHIMFATVLLFQPFRYLVVPVVLLAGAMTYALRTIAGTGPMVVNYEMAVQGLSFTALLFAYLRECSERQLFATSVEVRALRSETQRQQANQINWLSNLSRYLEHELRDNVFIVQSNLEFLQQDVSAERRPLVQRAMDSAVKLNELCDSVGEASKLESALQLDSLHPVNLSRIVSQRVLERARGLEEANPLELDIDSDLWVAGSEPRLLQVFDTLLNNALEHSTENASVRLELKSVAGTVFFTAHNRGEPLPEDRNIFVPFDLGLPTTSLGMGLYVASKIVEHHQGAIETRNEPGQTIVIVSLPQVAAPVSLAKQSGAEAATGTEKGHSSVVDINRLMRKP